MCEVKAEVDRSATGWEGVGERGGLREVGEHLGAGVAERGEMKKKKKRRSWKSR